MPHPKNPSPPANAPAPPAPSKTSHLFGKPKNTGKGPLTREAIEADLDAFRKAGGKIEVLGVTRHFTRIGIEPGATPPDTPPAPAKRRR